MKRASFGALFLCPYFCAFRTVLAYINGLSVTKNGLSKTGIALGIPNFAEV